MKITTNVIDRSINLLPRPLSHAMYAIKFGVWIVAISRNLISVVTSVMLSAVILESARFIFAWDQSEIEIPFWVFSVLFAGNLVLANYVINRLIHFLKSDIFFHFIFLLVVLNIVSIGVHSLGVYVYSWVYLLAVSVYLLLVTFSDTRLFRFWVFTLVFFLLYNLVIGSEIPLIISNIIVYRVSRRRRRLKRRFFHGFVPSIAPAQWLITLFYRQYGDTVFLWSYTVLAGSLVYIGLSLLAFAIFGTLYHRFISKVSSIYSINGFLVLIIRSGLVSGAIYMMTGFLILTNLSHLPTGFLELYNLIARLGLQYDYQSYVLFLSYGIGIYIISRSWVVIFRWIIFQLVRREYVIDLDYQAVKPIVYGFRPFPLFWKFPRLWFRDIFESPKPFRRSVSPEQPDDAVYYYGGPNPNMVIFDPYTGSVIFLLIKDLIHENYRIYYKLLKFAARKLPIQLLPMHEKIWSFSWVADARRRSRARSLRSRAPYYYYTRRDIQSDYWLNRFLVLEDATKDNSEQDSNLGSEDNEKSFFDTHLWESVWLRGFGRSMPSHIPANLVQHNFLNPFLDTRWSRPGIYPSQFREDYQDLLMFRLRYLFRQSLNINQSIGLIPSEIGRGQLLFDSRIGSVDQASGIGMRNFILSSLGGSGRDPNLGMYFDIGDYVSQVIYRLQIKYFQEVQCFIPERNRTLPDRLWFLDRPLSFFMLHPKNQILSYSILTRFILRKLSLDLFNKYSGSSLFQSNFTDCYNVCRLERSFSQAIYGGQPRPLASLSVPINWFGFCGRDLRQNLVGDEVTSLIDRFATLDRSQYSFERIFSNLPPYNYLVKQPSEFYGIFETPDESQPDSQQGRSGRFCFVNSRILLENDRKSKVNNFFVDLNTWSIRFGGFRREESSYFESLKRYTCQQYFILGMVAYQKLRSSIPLVTQALSLSRVGGLELSSTQFYKLGLINFNLDTSITQTNPQFLTREERYYGKLPFVGFTHAVLADPSLGPSHRRPALQGLSITGSDIPLAYVHSPTSILYSNSFFMQSFYSQVCPSMCSRDYFSSPSTAVLSSARFKLPMFYPIFDRWFMNSIPRGVVLSPSILNGMSSGYITGVAFKHFRRFPVRPLRVVYDTHLHWRFRFSGYYGSMHILTWWCRYVFSHPVPVIPYCWVTKKSKLPLFHQFCFDRRSTTRSRTRTAYRSRRWRYNWGVKFVWSVGSVARFEYYSATEQSRLVESFADRVETYSSSCSAQPIESGYNLSKFWLHVTPTTSGWFICSRDL